MSVAITSNHRNFLKLLCQGKRPKQIAEVMGKSPRTIDGYRDALFLATGARSQASLVAWSFNHGLVTPNAKSRSNIRSSARGRPSFKEQVKILSEQNKTFGHALETIIRKLQIVKEDIVCNDIIQIAEKALKIKTNGKSNNRKMRPGRRGRKAT